MALLSFTEGENDWRRTSLGRKMAICFLSALILEERVVTTSRYQEPNYTFQYSCSCYGDSQSKLHHSYGQFHFFDWNPIEGEIEWWNSVSYRPAEAM